MFDYRDYPLKLNLGCGFDKKEGYLNIDLNDFHQPDLVADVTSLDMLPDCHYEEIYANDVLEHIRRDKIETALREWGRVLKPGGAIEIKTTNVINLAELMRETSSFEKSNTLIQCMFGTQNYTGDYHYAGFTPVLIERMLRNIGFTEIVLENVDQWMMRVRAKKQLQHERRHPEILFSFGFYNLEPEGHRWAGPFSQIIVNNCLQMGCMINVPHELDNLRLLYAINGGG